MSIMRNKRRLLQLLRSDDLDAILVALGQLPAEQVLNTLFAGICRADEISRWHAVSAMGPTVARLAADDMEAARIVMRRFMWSLNDESGGIGWGAPESMAEIMAVHAGLATEYAHILVSYMREDGNFLELPALQRGLLWGVGRLAAVRPGLLRERQATLYLPPYLRAADATVRGLAARALSLLDSREDLAAIRELLADPAEIRLYDAGRLLTTTVGQLAAEAVRHLTARERAL